MSTYRTFRAATTREALEKVRAELGEGALILGQRELYRRRFPWVRSTREMELTAAIGAGAERLNQSSRRRSEAVASEPEASEAVSTRDVRPLAADRDVGSRHSIPVFAESRTVIRGWDAPGTATRVMDAAALEVQEKNVPAGDPSQPQLAFCDLFHLYTHLIEQDLDEVDARELLGRMGLPFGSQPVGLEELRRCMCQVIADLAPCSGAVAVDGQRQRVAALVGPTGVGKTTTIAKLAAGFRLREGRRVGLVTVDTYRVAAIDQLRTYAQLIDVPLRVVSTPREIPQALDELSHMDLVLIDTAGRSPQDDLRIQELRSFLQAARADEVHLVLSLATSPRAMQMAAERFQQVGPTSVLLTKLDEACGPGAILSAARRIGRPLSYVTTGQDVPDDIEIASADRIVQRLITFSGGTGAQAVDPAAAGKHRLPESFGQAMQSRSEFIDCRNSIKTDNLGSRI